MLEGVQRRAVDAHQPYQPYPAKDRLYLGGQLP